ncbi:50S ribosomal protein L6 [Pseudothermotoga thermarum]|uniref:Large ribosomal subunit protein uL6 n=1 Tax=Pseudothermotoga thermarum DSM 5069 TaxID=688269 RepID=F7YY07_9THEM|nr:50S ribosomal protein L6 [Pseudothermotoga thermarum]AEH50814.1 LSU ribosomal protein L6P [Pseudothermotoga thermarum DSM 5069]
MSKLAKRPIVIPPNVQVQLIENKVIVKGPKGTLEQTLSPYVVVSVEDGKIYVKQNEAALVRRSMRKTLKMHQGTYWALIRNMVIGVTQGYEKQLEIVGVGYRAQVQGKKLTLQVGYTHPVVMEVPEGLSVETPTPTSIIVRGADKQKVGQFAAEIRKVREPNVYTGKGIMYKGEVIRRKEGKKA